MNPSRYSGRTPWMWDWPITRPLPTWDSTTHKDRDKHPCLEWDSDPWSQLL